MLLCTDVLLDSSHSSLPKSLLRGDMPPNLRRMAKALILTTPSAERMHCLHEPPFLVAFHSYHDNLATSPVNFL